MTEEERLDKELAEAKARLKAAQSGTFAAPKAPSAAPAVGPRASGRSPSVVNLDDEGGDDTLLELFSSGFSRLPFVRDATAAVSAFQAAGQSAFSDETFSESFGRNAVENTQRTEAFALGAGDTITLGFSDELSAGAEVLFTGGGYEDAWRRNRDVLLSAEENNGGAFLAGQIAGGFIPGGQVGRAAGLARAATGGSASIGRAALTGGAFGAVYGYGSGDDEDILSTNRLQNAAVEGLYGLGGGFILSTAVFQGTRLASAGYKHLVQHRIGKSPKLDFEFKPIGSGEKAVGDVAEDLSDLRKSNPQKPGSAQTETPKAKPKVNRITGKKSNELQPGAAAAADDIIEPSAKLSLMEKLTKLTPQQARTAARKIDEVYASGDFSVEPHYRSIAGIDLSEYGDIEDVIPYVSNMLHEMSEEIKEKAGGGKTTVKSVEARLRAQYGAAMSEGQLAEVLKKTQENEGFAAVGKIQSVLAGIHFARAARDLLPQVTAGSKEARAKLTEELSKGLRVSAMGQMLASQGGRELALARHTKSLLFKEMAEGPEVESLEQITARVNASLAKFDDDALNEMLAQVRDMSNLNEVSKILMDPARAEKVNLFYRSKNTVEMLMKSTVLTAKTAVVNLVGVPMHNFMRNDGPRAMAEAALRLQGNENAALRVALQRQVVDMVRWESRKIGMVAVWNRVKWESFDTARNISSVAGASKIAARASSSRQALIAGGYRPPQIREFDLEKRLAVTDLKGFEDKLAERAASDMPFASFVNALERAGAVALNTFDAVGSAPARFFSGVLDDYGRATIMTREAYADMAAAAFDDAIRNKVPVDKIADHVSKKVESWASLPPQDILERIERKIIDGDELDEVDRALINRDYKAEKEAEAVLFLDGPQTKFGRSASNILKGLDTAAGLGVIRGALFPYIATPSRILERGLVSYTPWGKFTDEAKKALNSKDPVVVAMEKARMEIGGNIISAGMLLGAAGAITVSNGASYNNSEGIGGVPGFRLNFPGGGYVDISQLDPIATGVAMGAIIGQMHKAAGEAEEKYGQDDAIATAFAVAFGGMREAIFGKAYFKTINNLFAALTGNEENGLINYLQSFAGDTAVRLIPGAGLNAQVNQAIAGRSLEAVSVLDKIAKATPGMGTYLPTRIDPLGNEIEADFMGVRAGTTSDDDPVTAQLRDLGVDITNLRKADPAGFDLTSEELAELRTIRANEAVNQYGQTMKEALSDLFQDPGFQALQDRSQVQDAVVSVMSDFNEPAREIFEWRNQTYLADREASRSFKEYLKSGLLSTNDAREAAREEVEAAGLTPTRTNALR